MASLKIPDRYKPGFGVLAGLPDSSFVAFLAAAKRAPNTFANNRELGIWLASEVSVIPAKDVSKLVESITSVFRLLSRYELTPQKLAADLVESAREGIGVKITDEDSFARNLTELLSVDSFNVISLKAKELQMQSERTFCEARIITDMRPIFGERTSEAPSAMMVVHTLKIVSHELGGHKELYVALDSDDIASLKKALERAEEKEKSLKALIDTTGLRNINLQ